MKRQPLGEQPPRLAGFAILLIGLLIIGIALMYFHFNAPRPEDSLQMGSPAGQQEASASAGEMSFYRDSRGLVALANPTVADRADLPSRLQSEISNMVDEYNARRKAYVTAQIDAWKRDPDWRTHPAPDLHSPKSPHYQHLQAMHAEVERQIEKLLNPEQRWRSQVTLITRVNGEPVAARDSRRSR